MIQINPTISRMTPVTPRRWIRRLLHLYAHIFGIRLRRGPLRGYHVDDWYQYCALEGDYEPAVASVVMQHVREGSHCVDVGAFVGFYTLLLARHVGASGRIYAFEAHPGNCALLRRVVCRNRLEARVTVENLAVSDGMNATLRLYHGRQQSRYSEGEYSPEYNLRGQDIDGQTSLPACEVNAVALDDYFEGSRRVDFVKIDIEGAEAQALHGMSRLLCHERPFLLIEVHGEEPWMGCATCLQHADYLVREAGGTDWLPPAQASPTTHIEACAVEKTTNATQ